MNYLYNAAGQKIEKKVHDTQNNTIKQVEYLDGFQYAGGVLQFFPTAEGYVAATKNVNGIYIYNYVYNYTDHLDERNQSTTLIEVCERSSIRLSYTKDPVSGELEIMEEIEERDSRTPKKKRSHKINNSEQNHTATLTSFDLEILNFQNLTRPFGLKHSVFSDIKQKYELDEEEESLARPTYVYETEYQYKYNGKEWQDELGLNVYDYGARMYMPDIGRWGATDNKAELYFATSPYVYALNQPTNAIDPDGNLVIFINGNHYGSGSSKEYWKGEQIGTLTVGDSSSPVYRRFDTSVMRQLNDYNPMYRDGSGGGFAPLCGSCLSSSARSSLGEAQGKIDAKGIIKNLARDPQGNIIESIKIITHSMGSAYGKGYVKALKEYIRSLPIEQQKQIKITLVADFDPYQGGSLTADPDIFTQQFTHIGGSFGLADERQEGLDDDNYYEDDEEKAHAIMTFMNDIPNLQEGTYEWNNKTKKMECTTCKKEK